MLTRFFRRIFPSVPILGRTIFARLLDMLDILLKSTNPEWRRLPPASLRMRIGVGNNLLFNHAWFMRSGIGFVQHLSSKGFLHPDFHVVEIGCGCGRIAIPMSDFLNQDGNYLGVDVDLDMIQWCKAHLENKQLRFSHANIFSKVYNPQGGPSGAYRFPQESHSSDLIIASSLFTHLLYEDFVHYIHECRRMLKPDGYLHMSLFLMEYIEPRLGGRWTFQHRLGEAYIEDLRYPEAAVGYEMTTVKQLLEGSGFQLEELSQKESDQQMLIWRLID